jgi:ABC-type uncharacterized transport system involved in gliding motility auxiliary subunit
MNTEEPRAVTWQNKYAPYGLYLALVALILSIGLYIVQREFNLYLQIGLGLIVLGLAAFVILDPERVKRIFVGRQVRYGSNLLILGIAFIGILAVVNYLMFNNPKRWDLTEDQENTLTKETMDTIDAFPGEVSVVGYFSPEMPSDEARSLLDDYAFYSDGKISYQFVDPLANPVAAQQANITRDGTIVFTSGNRQEQVTYASEQEFTGALVRLLSDEQKAVYFLEGHGEYSPEETGAAGYSLAKQTLEGKNYTVSNLNLLVTNAIPEDAAVIIVAGPIYPLEEQEVALLGDYVSQGGALIVMEEPLPLTEFDDHSDLLAKYLLESWDIQYGADIVIDQTSQQPFVAYADQYGSHVITEKMQRVATAYPTSRSVQITENLDGVYPIELVLTASQSWAESDFEALDAGEEVVPDEGDLVGPVPLAVVVEATLGENRVAVFGDADFANDENFTYLGNGDMFINTVDWAAGQEALINLTPKNQTERLLLPPQPYFMNLVLLLVVFVIPGVVLISGIVVWIRKRQRG